jgi:FlaA1/EpsC-like NDP-sugar epimerase
VTVRFGNVLNSAGSVVPTFRRQIEAGGPISVTHPEMERFFMTIPEAVQLVLQAGAVGSSGDVLILEMGEPVRIVDLAKDMITLSGLHYPADIGIEFTGMRPGEKLREELFYTSEERSSRVHDKIFCARRSDVSRERINRDISRLQSAALDSRDAAATALWDVVETYVVQDQEPTTGLKKAA